MELVEDEDTGAQAPKDLIKLPGLGRRIARFGLKAPEGP
jgi:endonuclease III